MLNITLSKSLMVKLGLSQKDLAERCNVSKEAVSNWLSGESFPRPNKLIALAEALNIAVEKLLESEDSIPAPIIAYRTRKNLPVTGAARDAADSLARHLRELVPFIHQESMFSPPVLEKPCLDDSYIREVVRQIRSRIGVTPKAPLTREKLLELHRDFGSVLVPVIWGEDKAGHENALNVYLPESKMYWVVFNLNARNDDFNYWLAHELGHCYSLHAINGENGERFAERFAQELLFPLDVACDALVDIKNSSHPMERVNWYAGNYDISIVTVIRQADRAATYLAQDVTGLENPNFWAEWNSSRNKIPTVAELMFGMRELSAEEYVLKSESLFATSVFRAIAQWQLNEGGRSPAFIAEVLNIGIGEALELSHIIAKL